MKLRVAVLAASVALLGTGCVTESSVRAVPTFEDAAANPFVPANYAAADALLTQLKGRIPASQALLMGTIVNIDALDSSSTLGRTVSEQVSARFAQAGHRMIEMKFRSSVYMARNQGELMLTRELSEIASSHDARAVVVGTYAESSDFVFVNLKVIDPHTNVAMAVHDYALPMDRTVRSMLRTNRR